MSNSVKLFVIVQDHEHHILSDVRVSGSKTAKGPFDLLPYDRYLQHHVLDKLDIGKYIVIVEDDKGERSETRTICLKKGDNHICVMLGEPGMVDFEANGMRYYFPPKEDSLLVSVKGITNEEQVTGPLSVSEFKYKILSEPISTTGKRQLLLTVDMADSDKQEKRAQLQDICDKEFKKYGLPVRLAIPVYKKGKPTFGITNDIIIKFSQSVAISVIEKFAKQQDLTLVRNIKYLGNCFLFRRNAPINLKILDHLKDIQKDNMVAYAEPDLLMLIINNQYIPNDYLYPEVPHLSLIKCDVAWQTLANQSGGNAGGDPAITIAVLDKDGVDPTHPDLIGPLSDGSEKMLANFDFDNMVVQTYENLSGSHGTQCAGSATARMDNNYGVPGVAPNCHLIGGRVGAAASTLEISDMWVWMAGFETGSSAPGFPSQLAKGADIISNSWLPFLSPDTLIVRDVLDLLTTFGREGKGCLVTFAAGNNGHVLIDNFYPYLNDAKTITVGATINTNPTVLVNSMHVDHNGNGTNLPAVVDTRSYFSPYGMSMDIVSPSNTSMVPNGFGGVFNIDPILAPVNRDYGDWPANDQFRSTLIQDANTGDTDIQVADTSGFQVSEYVLIGDPGSSPNETKRITNVSPSQVTIGSAPMDPPGLKDSYTTGTSVITGDNDYAKNQWSGFGGTSHSCPTVAGALALILSAKPDLTWIEARSLLLGNAEKIDALQTSEFGQWIVQDDGTDFSQWYGYGRLDVSASVNAALNFNQRADMLIRDNLTDTGTVPSPGWHAHSPDIWIRRTDDPIPAIDYDASPPHENPRYGQDNYVYLRVKNVGTGPCPTCYARALIVHWPGVEFQYPDDWQPSTRLGEDPTLPLEPGSYLIGEVEINDLAPNESRIVKMTLDSTLVPPETVNINGTEVRWHPCLLAEVSPIDGPPPASGVYDVKAYNNLAHRNLAIDYPSGAGWSFFMAAVVIGTRYKKGMKELIIDRSDVPSHYNVVLQTPDDNIMRQWIKILDSGSVFESVDPLGSEWFSEKSYMPISLNKLFYYLRGLVSKFFYLLCRFIRRFFSGRKQCLQKCIWIDEYNGRPIIKIGRNITAISIPVRLSSNHFSPMFIGIERMSGKRTKQAVIRVTQRREDERLSPGYEIRG